MRILILSQFAPPELGAAPSRLAGHARRWREAGHEVTVVTNLPNSPTGAIFAGYRNRLLQTEEIDSVRYRRVFTIPAGKRHSILRRAIAALISAVGMFFGGLGQRPDVILATAPYFAGFPAGALSLLTGSPLVYELRDPWVAVATLKVRRRSWRWALACLRALERLVMWRAQAIVVATPGMVEAMVGHLPDGQEVTVITNGVERPSDHPRMPLSEKPVVLGHLGNLGSQYDFDFLLALAQRNPRHLVVEFLGTGGQRDRLEAWARDQGIANVRFRDPVPPEALDGATEHWWAAVVPLRGDAVFRCYLPAKLFDSLGRGIPVLVTSDGDAADLIRASGAGTVLDSKNLAAWEQLLLNDESSEKLSQMGSVGLDYARKELSRSVQAERLLDVLEHVHSEAS